MAAASDNASTLLWLRSHESEFEDTATTRLPSSEPTASITVLDGGSSELRRLAAQLAGFFPSGKCATYSSRTLTPVVLRVSVMASLTREKSDPRRFSVSVIESFMDADAESDDDAEPDDEAEADDDAEPDDESEDREGVDSSAIARSAMHNTPNAIITITAIAISAMTRSPAIPPSLRRATTSTPWARARELLTISSTLAARTAATPNIRPERTPSWHNTKSIPSTSSHQAPP